MQAPPISQDELNEVLDWIDQLRLSRPKKNFNRDFSDGVLVAQILQQYYPTLVQLHNYQSANSSTGKYVNWKTLNEKCFRKIGLQIHRNDIENIITVVPGAIQRVLFLINQRLKNNRKDKSLKQYSENAPKLVSFESASGENPYQKIQREKEKMSVLEEREAVIRELRDTIEILQAKMTKMEQLSKLKDSKIESLLKRIEEGT